MSGLPERLADVAWELCGHDVAGGLCVDCCATAIRQALDEAALVARNMYAARWIVEVECGAEIAGAIEALK